MMLRLTPKRIALIAILWEALFVLLAITGYNQFQVLNIVGFLTLAILPGALTVILLRLPQLPSWANISLAVGFSLLELMVIALLGNTFLPKFGILRPLDVPFVLAEFVLIVNVLVALVMRYAKEIRISIYPYILFRTKRDVLLALTPVLFTVLSIFGAFRLNNGASNIFTMVMLGSVAVYIVILIYYSKKVGDNVVPTALFFITLALLLMTSLRGLFVTGHDIQQEYKVFQLTQTTGLWNIAIFREAYNACLSITILPTIFGNLLSVAPQYVFKLLFQFFFALTPILTYYIADRWTEKRIALISTIYFLGFPTFYTDMPFLIRQEIAFLFYGLTLYVIFEPKLNILLRRTFFVVFGIGVIMSHYSTTYTILVILGLAVFFKPLIVKLFSYLKNRKLFKHSSVITQQAPSYVSKINAFMIIILFIMSFLWTSLITQTGNTVTSVVGRTVVAIRDGFGVGNRSGDATTLLTFNRLNPDQQMQAYIKSTILPLRANGYQGEYYQESAYSQYTTPGLPESKASVTRIGNFFNRLLHVDMSNVVRVGGQIFSKLIELLIPIGVLYLILRKKIISTMDPEIFLITIFSLVFMALTIFLPVLSVAYGILRAFQQSLFIIAPVIVVGSMTLWKGIQSPFKKQKTAINSNRGITIFASAFVIAYFLYFTGFTPQLFGNNVALLHLNNTGTYYDDFYVHGEELRGVSWLSSVTSDIQNIQFDVQSDRFSAGKITSISRINPSNDIFPSIVKRDAYVYLGYANATKQRATELYSGNRITYGYPIEFLDLNKNLIYNNGGSRVYK